MDIAPPRFFVALLPPAHVQDYAIDVIRELGDRYRTRTSKAPPHITLKPPFDWPLATAPALKQQLQDFAQTQAAAPIRLSGFGAFAPRVLYVNVAKTPTLLMLQANLLAHLETSLGIVDPQSKRRPFAPHLTVASRNLTRQTFTLAWADLQQRPVEFEFTVQTLTLLIHQGRQWDIHADVPLMAP